MTSRPTGGTGGHDRDEGHSHQVYLVTSASRPHSEEMSGRLRRYLISMSIRTVCVALAIFVLSGWLRLVGIVVGLVLPWLAVVFANAGPAPGDEEPTFVTAGRPELDAGPDRSLDAGADARGHRV